MISKICILPVNKMAYLRNLLRKDIRTKQRQIEKYGFSQDIVKMQNWVENLLEEMETQTKGNNTEHQMSVLASLAQSAFAEEKPPVVAADKIRPHLVTLAGLLDGMQKIDFKPKGQFRDYWQQLQETVAALIDLLPENEMKEVYTDDRGVPGDTERDEQSAGLPGSAIAGSPVDS